jgi:hypothetical protein
MHTFKENNLVHFGEITSALGGETSDTITTMRFPSMENYDTITFIAIASEVASGSTLTLTAYEATAADGSGSSSISGATDTFLSTNVTDTDVLIVQVNAPQLTAGYQYVGAKLVSNNGSGTEEAAIITIQSKPRYAQATLVE